MVAVGRIRSAAELAATAGALIGAAIGNRYGGPAGAAIGGVLGEGLAFYGFVVVRELRTARDGRRLRRVLSDLLAEFGPAEVLDTVAVRPAAMYAGPLLVGDLLVGILVGKVAADLVFYAIAAAAYELSRRAPAAADPLTPAAPDAGAHRTPTCSSTSGGSSAPTGTSPRPCRSTMCTTR